MALGETTLLITFHPETGRVGTNAQSQMMELLAALESVDASLVFTMPNADVGGRGLFELVQAFVSATLSARLCAYLSRADALFVRACAVCGRRR